LGKTICRMIALSATLFALALASVCNASITIRDAFCRGGQTFIHWSDPSTSYIHYHVYRLTEEITLANIASAELIDSNAPLHSAKDLTATYIASRKSLPDPNIGLRISDLGTPLDPTDCLRVFTVPGDAQIYYAVLGVNPDGTEDHNIIPGENSLSEAIGETIGSRSPVLDEEGVITIGIYPYPWKTYNWFRRYDETLHDGEATKVTITFPNTSTTQIYSTMLYLHAIGGYNATLPWWNTLVIEPCDYTSGLPFSQNSWWYGYCDAYPNVSSGTVVNYSETMLLHMLDWAKANCPIDPNRVFVQGGSMGGTGAVSFGLRHPELFAGISAQVPQVNPGLPGIGWPQTALDDIWGSVTANLPTNDGAGVWDRMNMTAYVAAHNEDLPFLKVQNSKNDATLLWFQIPDFYKNLNASRHGFISAWGQGGHNDSGHNLLPQFLSFNIYDKIRLNQSYVAVSNSSANNNPGNGLPTNGDDVGQMNAGYDWQINSDTSQLWSANIKYTVAGATTADISARRLQAFSFSAGEHLAYALRDTTTGSALAWGRVTAERDRFFAIERLPFDGNWHELTVWKSSGQTIADVKSMLEGANVDLDAVVVTAVFPGVCYAQAPERVPSIAILGASGLTEGSVIHLRGMKTTFGQMPAVNASPAAQSACGKVALKPLGMAQPFMAPNSTIVLGALVKVWGPVGSSGPDWFTLVTGSRSTLIFGNVGAAEDFATAVGIAAETAGPHGESRGIRVRRASDITNF